MRTLDKIYDSEREAGLADLLSQTGSMAIITSPLKLNSDANFAKVLAFLQKNLASVQSVEELVGVEQEDLSLIVSVLASVGWNKNDDIFTPEELWKARGTAIHKPINDMHDSNTILGHMIESYAVDKSGNRLTDMPDTDYDVEVAGVLYSGLEELSERIGEILTKAQTNEIFVSMEAWFPTFGYGLIDPLTGTTHVIERTEATAFLTKHLRIYDGTGEYEGYRVGRVLQNFVFGGKGIVDKPANPESVIRVAAATSSNFENSNLETLSEGGVTSMTETEIQAMQEKLDKAEADVKSKDAEIAKLTEELTNANELVSKVEELTSTITEINEKLEALEGEKTESDKNLTEATDRAEKAETELAVIRKTGIAKNRLAKLSEVRDVENQEETLSDLIDMDDNEFERLLKYAGPVKAEETKEEVEVKEDEEVVSETETETEAATAALDEVVESKDDPDFQGGTETVEETEAEGFLALAHSLLDREPEKKE